MIRLASELQTDSIVDGKGIRAVIWAQGCSHNCPGCHNQQTRDFKGGFSKNIEELKMEISALEFQDGVTFSGGDPFFQPRQCAELAKHIKTLGMNVWCYTGFTFEELLKMSADDKDIKCFLENIDIMIDGRFIISKRTYSLSFRGSSNQRIIDVKKSLEKKKAVLVEFEEEATITNFGRSEELIFI